MFALDQSMEELIDDDEDDVATQRAYCEMDLPRKKSLTATLYDWASAGKTSWAYATGKSVVSAVTSVFKYAVSSLPSGGKVADFVLGRTVDETIIKTESANNISRVTHGTDTYIRKRPKRISDIPTREQLNIRYEKKLLTTLQPKAATDLAIIGNAFSELFDSNNKYIPIVCADEPHWWRSLRRDKGETFDDNLFVKYLDGYQTLLEFVNANVSHRVPYFVFNKIFQSCEEALTQLHGFQVIHGDIKPANIMFKMENIDNVKTIKVDVKFVDLGSACYTGTNSTEEFSCLFDTKTDRGLGTPPYQYPLVHRYGKTNELTDHFSLYMVFCQCFSYMYSDTFADTFDSWSKVETLMDENADTFQFVKGTDEDQTIVDSRVARFNTEWFGLFSTFYNGIFDRMQLEKSGSNGEVMKHSNMTRTLERLVRYYRAPRKLQGSKSTESLQSLELFANDIPPSSH